MKLDINRPILFIDGSYYVFYRYYAIYNWWRKQNEAKRDIKPMSDPLFKEKYAKLFKSQIANLIKVYEIAPGNVVFAKDCCREDIWRNDHTTAYKALRDESRQLSDTFDPEAFSYAYDVLMPDLEAGNVCQSVSIKKLEADDIVAVATKEVLLKNPDADITIITNDNDYIQLLSCIEPSPENIRLINLQGKDLSKRAEQDIKDIRNYLRYKIIVGDKSDNIPAIAPKIGPKTAEKLATNETELTKLFTKNPTAKVQYEKNDLLINFDRIPEDLADKVRKAIKLV